MLKENTNRDQSVGSEVCGEGEPRPSEDSFLSPDEELPYDDT